MSEEKVVMQVKKHSIQAPLLRLGVWIEQPRTTGLPDSQVAAQVQRR